MPAGLAVGAFVGAALLAAGAARRPRDRPRPIATIRGSDRTPTAPCSRPTWWRRPTRTGALALEHAGHGADPVAPTAASDRPGPSRTSRARRTPVAPPLDRATGGRELLWIVPLVLIVATEFKIRRRNIDDVLEGRIDLLIAVELVVYAVVGVWALWRLVPSTAAAGAAHHHHVGIHPVDRGERACTRDFPTLAIARGVQLVIIGAVVQLMAVDGDLARSADSCTDGSC